MIETPQRKTQGKNIEINFVIVDGKLRTWIEQENLADGKREKKTTSVSQILTRTLLSQNFLALGMGLEPRNTIPT